MKLLSVFAFLMALASPALAAQRAADLLPAIEAALIEQGASADAEVRLAAPDLAIADGATIESLSYNPRSGRFVARAAGAVIAGTARAATETPVLIEPVARGEEIAEDNIAFLQTADVLPADVALTLDDLAGKEARRNLGAGAPLRRSDVVAPILVKRNALVTVSYERPGVVLTQTGVAQVAGSQGEVIDIETASGRIVRAVVIGRDRARVVGARQARLQ